MTKLTKEQIDEKIRNHSLWLRGEEGGERLSLGYADLSISNMDYVKLGGANLHRSNLYGAHLEGADLSDSDLVYANLHGAHLKGANLQGADLVGADLLRADLRYANLRGADLHGAHLEGAKLGGANLQGSKLDKKVVQIGCIGSRRGITTYCIPDDHVLCGCWNRYKGGTLAEFETRVADIYGEGGYTPDATYYQEYLAAIKFFKAIRG